MNVSTLAQSAYSKAASIAPSFQDVEYRAFGEITRQLKETAGGSRDVFAARAEAIHKNLKLWSILATDVAGKENALPQVLRAQIFYLFEFTFLHSQKVLSGDADTEVLVDINTAVMKGLRGDVAEAPVS